jgi:hypothetical protein
LRSLPTDSGTVLNVAGNGRYARKVVIACKRERARRLHTVAPTELAKSDPSVLVVNADDMARTGIGTSLAGLSWSSTGHGPHLSPITKIGRGQQQSVAVETNAGEELLEGSDELGQFDSHSPKLPTHGSTVTSRQFEYR